MLYNRTEHSGGFFICFIIKNPIISLRVRLNFQAKKLLKVCSPGEFGRIVAHENVYFFNGNYGTRSSKLAGENAKC